MHEQKFGACFLDYVLLPLEQSDKLSRMDWGDQYSIIAAKKKYQLNRTHKNGTDSCGISELLEVPYASPIQGESL